MNVTLSLNDADVHEQCPAVVSVLTGSTILGALNEVLVDMSSDPK